MFSKIETKQIVGRESQRAHWPKAQSAFLPKAPDLMQAQPYDVC